MINSGGLICGHTAVLHAYCKKAHTCTQCCPPLCHNYPLGAFFFGEGGCCFIGASACSFVPFIYLISKCAYTVSLVSSVRLSEIKID